MRANPASNARESYTYAIGANASEETAAYARGYPPFLNYYYGYFEDTGNNGDPNDYKLVLNLRQWGPDGQLTDLWYNEKEFYPVTEDGDDRVW